MSNIEKTIAIKGHRTRGAEVIKALEELGGKNSLYLEGVCIGSYYYIDDRGYITAIHTNEVEKINNKNLRTLTLEEYLTTKTKSTNMKKKIAIRGHQDRSVEVIEILKQLGGRNSFFLIGGCVNNIYFIDNNNNIDYMPVTIKDIDKYYQIYTLEEYLETLNQTEQRNNKTQRQLSVDIETAKQWYKSNNVVLEQIALSLFTEEELTKVEFPTSWEEFCEQNTEIDCEYYINNTSEINLCLETYRANENDKNLLETQEDAEAILALIQLKRLRDAWWKALNYQPNWTDNKKVKYCIVIYSDGITLETRNYTNEFLAFPTQESRNQFYTHFKDLILKAKPFLS